jgi:hypothetical protein
MARRRVWPRVGARTRTRRRRAPGTPPCAQRGCMPPPGSRRGTLSVAPVVCRRRHDACCVPRALDGFAVPEWRRAGAPRRPSTVCWVCRPHSRAAMTSTPSPTCPARCRRHAVDSPALNGRRLRCTRRRLPTAWRCDCTPARGWRHRVWPAPARHWSPRRTLPVCDGVTDIIVVRRWQRGWPAVQWGETADPPATCAAVGWLGARRDGIGGCCCACRRCVPLGGERAAPLGLHLNLSDYSSSVSSSSGGCNSASGSSSIENGSMFQRTALPPQV